MVCVGQARTKDWSKAWMDQIREKFGRQMAQIKDFLDQNLENILFWSAAAILVMMYLVLFAMLAYYQRRYLG